MIADRDELLVGLLNRVVDGSRHGRDPDFAAALDAANLPPRERGDVECELRELWATAMVAEDLATVSRTLDGLADTPADGDGVLPLGGALPRTVGDYELHEVVGRGGMGLVFRGRQVSLNRTVAVKMILRGEFATPEDLLRFRSEAEAAARLNHPLIVPVYEVGDLPPGSGQPFFSMQFIEGRTLARRLQSGPMRSREAAALLSRVCRAIQAAHEQGVLHRDLKPSNILIDPTGRPYVTDFGLAKLLEVNADVKARGRGEEITISGAILGTPGYMAPEQAIGSRGVIGPITDVYALGAVLYAMLAGRPPFQAATAVDTVLLVLEQEPPPIAVLNPQVDADLEMIALKALQKPTDLRYASAAALADDLDAYLAHEPVTARSSHITQILSRALRPTHHAEVLENWGKLWMWHALVLLVLCLVTAWFQWRGESSRLPFLLLWTVGLGTWAAAFWKMRQVAGPVTFIERQIAHVWAGSMGCVMMLFLLEPLLSLPVLKLSPVLGLVAGTVFLIKAGMLSGEFYLQAVALYATAVVMALSPTWGLPVFGVVSAAAFFLPGLKFYRQRKQSGGVA